jgi:hypothetical protein
MSDLETIAKTRCNEPMSTWPQHNDFHRRNFHVFSGSRHGEMQWDEECLRCQLERTAAKEATEKGKNDRTCYRDKGHTGRHMGLKAAVRQKLERQPKQGGAGRELYPCKFCKKSIVDCGTHFHPGKCCKKCKGIRNHKP